MLQIGIDYGDSRNDYSTFVVSKMKDNQVHIIDTGFINDLDITKYVAGEGQITYIGEKRCLERFKKEFNIK